MMLGRILKPGSLAANIATKSPNDVHYNIPHLTVRQYAEDDLNYEEITEGGASKSHDGERHEPNRIGTVEYR